MLPNKCTSAVFGPLLDQRAWEGNEFLGGDAFLCWCSRSTYNHRNKITETDATLAFAEHFCLRQWSTFLASLHSLHLTLLQPHNVELNYTKYNSNRRTANIAQGTELHVVVAILNKAGRHICGDKAEWKAFK